MLPLHFSASFRSCRATPAMADHACGSPQAHNLRRCRRGVRAFRRRHGRRQTAILPVSTASGPKCGKQFSPARRLAAKFRQPRRQMRLRLRWTVRQLPLNAGIRAKLAAASERLGCLGLRGGGCRLLERVCKPEFPANREINREFWKNSRLNSSRVVYFSRWISILRRNSLL
jgi:hypothetical protein